MKFGSAFSGIGGFEVGFTAAGMEPTLLSEIDRDRQAVLAQHFPSALIKGDITDVRATDLSAIDLLVGGFPCKGTSIGAPQRAGLADPRSGMYFEFTRLLGDYLTLVDAANPRWVVIENPKGLLTSHGGRDMAAVVGGLQDLGYGWAYRVVDGNHLGTAQRRPRVLVVGHRGGDPIPAWDVLGDDGAGARLTAPHRLRGVEGRPSLAVAATGADWTVWRKSARPRAALSAGGYETWVNSPFSNTLTGFDGGLATRQTHLIAQNGRLRTLTLVEWERLMGFPDNWTAAVKSDSARYSMLGDAIHTGTAEWLGHRVVAVHNAIPQIAPVAA